jgi:threonine-phosphate decarboxylase
MIEGHGDDRFRYADIRMNFSSNIYGHADLSELYRFLSGKLDVIGSYPAPAPVELEKMVAEMHGVDAETVMVTNGATDAIYRIAEVLRCYGHKSYKVFHPTFSEYADASRIYGYTYAEDADVCWICNPNNPTGEMVSPAFMENLAEHHSWLVADQSYEDYTLNPVLSAKELLALSQVIQVRSLTKSFAVPGLRLGYIIAPPELIAAMKRFRLPWSVNSLALEAGEWLLRNQLEIIPDHRAYLLEAQRLRSLLNEVDGIEVMPTATNFMLCTIRQATSAQLKEHLATHHGMLIRDASNFEGLTDHHFRVAAQLPEENDALVAAIRDYLNGGNGIRS